MKLLAVFVAYLLIGWRLLEAQTTPQYTRIETIVIELSDKGFDRASVDVRPGRYFIEVRDQRRRAALGLDFTNAAGQSIFARASVSKANHVQLVQLTDGTFTLKARENPAWMVVINAKN